MTTWIESLPAGAWQRLSAGDGAKGPRLYDWAHLPYNGAAPGFACALLVRRSTSDPEEVTFYLTHAPDGTTLAELARVAGLRWAIESLFEQAKGEVGLDQYGGAVLGRVAPPRHALDVRPGLPRRRPPQRRAGRRWGVRTRQASKRTCCRSPCRRSGGSSRPWRADRHPGPTPSCAGQPGTGATSNAPNAPTGASEQRSAQVKPGGSTRMCVGT